MNEREIIRGMSRILCVDEKDIPKTLMRFRKEIEEMKSNL